MKSVITHAGKAHDDETLSIAILIAMGEVDIIYRRPPTPEELADHTVHVVDVGGVHDPEALNFDHHGIPGLEDKCALDLILEHYGLSAMARRASPWVDFVSHLDCTGPNKTAEYFQMPIESLYATQSPFKSQICVDFARYTILGSGDLWFEVLRRIGAGLLEYWSEFEDQYRRATAASIIAVKGELFLDFRQCGELHAAAKSAVLQEAEAAGSISVDDRDEGCERRTILYRHNDHPRVDFRRLDANSMHYVHHNGFLAKTKEDATTEEIVAMLHKSVAGLIP